MRAVAVGTLLYLGLLQALPGRAGMVNDFAHVLAAEAVVDVELTLTRLRRDTQSELVLVTLREARGEGAEELALRVRREWGVGGEGEGSWPGLVIAYLDQTGEIGVSYNDGARSWMPRGELERIIDTVTVPKLEKGDRSTALRDTMRAVARLFR